jgi:hypothetical protein
LKIVQKKIFLILIPGFLLCLTGSQSCFVSRSNARTEKSINNISVTPKIIFLNYSVNSPKSNGEPEIWLIDKFITEGKMKINSAMTELPKPGDLKCILLDNHLIPIDSLLISDPLNVTVESVDEKNQLFKREIAKDSAEFSIRLQLTDNIYAIGIKKSTSSGNKNSYLLITQIK